MSIVDPTSGPGGPVVPMERKLKLALGAAPLIGVIILSIGSIYIGIFTPVEASGVGAALVIALALVSGDMTTGKSRQAIFDTVKTSAMLYMIVIGANVLNPFPAMTHSPTTLGEGLAGLGLGPYGALAVIVLAYVILGMFLDGLAMLVVTIPIVFPIMMANGFDPIWFGVVAVIVVEMGMITPPVGLNVFVVQGIAPEVPMTTIFRGVAPFLLAMAVCLLLIVIFPQIALFLPNTMFN
jgi:tripartite ATP-independent transporter DctM subunit